MNVCPVCGRKWPIAAKFCPFDGAALGGEASVASEEESAEKTVTDLIQAVVDPSEHSAKAEEPNDTVVMAVPSFAEKEETPPPPLPEPEEELGKFSETSWFMAAADIEELNSDSENVSIDEERYRPDEDLESEIRKKFSLREPDEK